jgi:ComF family protein
MHVFERLIATIAPHRCLSCGAEGAPLCLPCCTSLPPAPECCYKCGKGAPHGLCSACRRLSVLQSITVRTIYEGVAQQAIHQLKFNRNRAMAAAIADELASHCTQGVITHIPTADRRIRQRGYDQAALIANSLARRSGQEVRAYLKRRGTQRQLGQSRSTRRQQLQGAFYIAHQPQNASVPIVLIDDVLTTGSTFEAAATILHDAGYRTIHACAFAWALP